MVHLWVPPVSGWLTGVRGLLEELGGDVKGLFVLSCALSVEFERALAVVGANGTNGRGVTGFG